jgi:hypothetical protein
MNQHQTHGSSLPHHRLLAYQKSLELLAAVAEPKPNCQYRAPKSDNER